MKQGYLKTALEAIGTVCILCAVFLFTGAQEQVQTVFSADVGEVEVPILMYHSVLKDQSKRGQYVVSPDMLAADLDYLADEGYETVTVRDLIAYTEGTGELPEKPVIITFDDGNFNNYVYAYPILKERGMCAMIAVIGSQTEFFSEAGTENANWSYLTTDRLFEMQDVFEIANHSWDLHDYGIRKGCARIEGEDEESYAKLLREDTEKTQDYLTDAGIEAPVCYAYPFGIYSEDSETVMRAMGFRCTLTCAEQINVITRDSECLYQLGRFNRTGELSTEAFMKERLGI